MTEVREQGKLERQVIFVDVVSFLFVCFGFFNYCYNAIWIKYNSKKDSEKSSSQNNFHVCTAYGNDRYYFTKLLIQPLTYICILSKNVFLNVGCSKK